jgi:hypothetical protein
MVVRIIPKSDAKGELSMLQRRKFEATRLNLKEAEGEERGSSSSKASPYIEI